MGFMPSFAGCFTSALNLFRLHALDFTDRFLFTAALIRNCTVHHLLLLECSKPDTSAWYLHGFLVRDVCPEPGHSELESEGHSESWGMSGWVANFSGGE